MMLVCRIAAFEMLCFIGCQNKNTGAVVYTNSGEYATLNHNESFTAMHSSAGVVPSSQVVVFALCAYKLY